MNLPRLSEALAAWATVVGPDAVLTDPTDLRRYTRCTTPTRRTIPSALLPKSVEHVSAIVRVANEFHIPLYPISTGHNWGYGSSNPPTDHCVIVDMGQMKRIVDFDPTLGLVTVEPGVTQADLRDFLDQQEADFLVPVTGAGPTCSLVGNALERGYGITPHADHFGAVMSIEAVLPDGQTYRGPHAEMNGDRVERAHKWGVGPYIDGLFAQGNVGIVTRMTIALARRPSQTTAVFFSVEQENLLEETVDRVREALTTLTGVLGSVNLMNRYRILSMMIARPDQAGDSVSVLPEDAAQALALQHGVSAWTGLAALYGEPGVVVAAARHLKRLLASCRAKPIVVSRSQARILRRLVDSVTLLRTSRFGKRVHQVHATFDILEGRPSEVALALAYWRSGKWPEHNAPDPAADGCGLIWYAPLVPMARDEVRTFVQLVNTICPKHGIDPLITLTSLSNRCFDATVPILYDKTHPKGAGNAWKCFEELFEAGRGNGFLPYRVGVDAMARMINKDTPYWGAVSKIKHVLDPNGIIAPGRYCP